MNGWLRCDLPTTTRPPFRAPHGREFVVGVEEKRQGWAATQPAGTSQGQGREGKGNSLYIINLSQGYYM